MYEALILLCKLWTPTSSLHWMCSQRTDCYLFVLLLRWTVTTVLLVVVLTALAHFGPGPIIGADDARCMGMCAG
jgi:hypothetical protein